MGIVLENYRTIQQNHRPFFSVICPCWNSDPVNIKELLDSILAQYVSKDDLEIIFTDDCSSNTEYFEVLKEYKDRLNIILVKTDGDCVHCPGNNRENGVSHATGYWVTFIDHDDLFIPDSFNKIRYIINECNETRIIGSNFQAIDPFTNEVRQAYIEKNANNWMHGKFYNLDNFWKKYNIHFIKDLVAQEDVAISSMTRCILYRANNYRGSLLSWLTDFTYLWRYWPNSTSNSESNWGKDYLGYMENHFCDFLRATIDTFIDDYSSLSEPNEKDILFHRKIQADMINYMYFYIQAFKYHKKEEHLSEYETKCKKYVNDYYERFNTNADELFNFILYEEGESWYNSNREAVTEFIGKFVEIESFKDFLSK